MSLYTKIHALQKDIDPIKKDSTNPFYHSQYFDINGLIDAVQPLLTKHGIVIMQPLSNINGESAICTIVVDTETGERIESVSPIPPQADVQKLGASITYMRRYALQSLLLLSAEDDDGNHAVSVPKQSPKSQPQESKLSYNDDPFEGIVSTFGGHEVVEPSGKICKDCKKGFTPKPGQDWATQCFNCWKAANPR